MKLFTLEFQVDFPRTPQEIANSVEIALGQEADLRGWNNDYTFYECQLPRQLPAGGVVYTYEVQGSYFNEENEPADRSDRQGATGSGEPSTGTAALPQDAEQ
jgi:hypothetical protein